jgi:regulator of protease activity HflC (stomatin/prohibitin superfamily)
MKQKTLLLATSIAAITLLVGCGERVRPGWVGVRVNNYGERAGVVEQELSPRFYWHQWGSDIIQFPTTVQTEVWQDCDSQRNCENVGGTAVSFTNADGVATRLAISMQLRVSPPEASRIVGRYRLGFQEMIDGPVRRRLQDAFVRFGQDDEFTSEALITGGKANDLLQRVHQTVSRPLATEGIIIENISLVGSPILPSQIIDRINDRVEAEQGAEAEEQKVRIVQAKAAQAIAEAEGRARAIAIEGAALNQNPQVLKLREIERWSGKGCPLDAQTCVLGGSALVQSQ